MRIKLQLATPDDVADLIALNAAVNERFRTRFGEGYWISKATEKGTLFTMRRAKVYVARYRNKLVARVNLTSRKPWAIDTKYFTPCARPLYIIGISVDPSLQGTGVGRQCIDEAVRIAREWPADAIRLDAWAEAVGAGEFYRKCGFREVGRATYHIAPLIYFEMLL
ncbi:MAG TPA: GNAT family N-acetyltransferase [Terracidiphilus sp.]|nr:GNAT family N-acetyltransferase [Terracidiphilus sp.]